MREYIPRHRSTYLKGKYMTNVARGDFVELVKYYVTGGGSELYIGKVPRRIQWRVLMMRETGIDPGLDDDENRSILEDFNDLEQ